MKRILYLTLVSCALSGLVSACTSGDTSDVTDTRTGPSRSYTMDEFMKTISVGGNSFSHDETRLLVSSNETGVYQVYELDLATNRRRAITTGEETTWAVAYMPQDDRILFRRDKDGSENNHLFLRTPDGMVRDLTTGGNTREEFAGFNTDLKTFFTQNNQRDPRFLDLFQWDVATLARTMVYENTEGLDPFEISPDGRWLVLSRSNTSNDTDLFVVDLDGGGSVPLLISEHEGQAGYVPQAVSPDGRFLYYSTNDGGEFLALKRYEFATGEHGDIHASDWDVVFCYFSLSGRYRVIGTNEDGYTRVNITRDEEPFTIHGLPEGTVSGIAFFPQREVHEAVRVERHHAAQHFPLRPGNGRSTATDRHPQPADRPRRPGRG